MSHEPSTCRNLATLGMIADKHGVTSEAVRLWSTGQRGPGGFPEPVITLDSGQRVYDLCEVEPWIIGAGLGAGAGFMRADNKYSVNLDRDSE